MKLFDFRILGSKSKTENKSSQTSLKSEFQSLYFYLIFIEFFKSNGI